jgi:hypothetical protein
MNARVIEIRAMRDGVETSDGWHVIGPTRRIYFRFTNFTLALMRHLRPSHCPNLAAIMRQTARRGRAIRIHGGPINA